MSGTGKPSVLVSEISGNWGGIEAFIENEVTPLQDEFDATASPRTTIRRSARA